MPPNQSRGPPVAPPLANTACRHPLLTTSLTPILFSPCRLQEYLLTSTATHPRPFLPETCASPSSLLCNAGFWRTPLPQRSDLQESSPSHPRPSYPQPPLGELPSSAASLFPASSQDPKPSSGPPNNRLPQPVFLISLPGVHLREQTPYPGFKSPLGGCSNAPS